MSTIVKTVLAALALAVALTAFAGSAQAANPVATAFDTQSGNIRKVTAGPGDALWFNGPGGVSKMTPDGSVTHVAPILEGFEAQDITAGPDGNLWVTQDGFIGDGQSAIARVTPAGGVTAFSAGLTKGNTPGEIAPGPDGALWFSQFDAEFAGPETGFGRITTSGAITNVPIPGADGIDDFAFGADGRIWFTELDPIVGAVDPESGEVEKWELGDFLDTNVDEMIAGPDGDIWFVQERNRGDVVQIKRIDSDGNISTVTSDLLRGSNIRELAAGGDGFAYAIDRTFDLIYRISPMGDVIAMTGSIDEKFKPLDLAVGPGGYLWVPSLRKMWRLSPELESTTAPVVEIEPLQGEKIKTRKRRIALSYDIAVDPADAEILCSTTEPVTGPSFGGCSEDQTYRYSLVKRATQRLGFSVLAEADGLVDPAPPTVVTKVKQTSPKRKGGKKGGKD
jgi:virginiamycin B lyase